MANFYRGDDEKTLAFPCRVMIAAATQPLPSRLSEIVNLTTYDANGTYGFADAGTTTGPVTIRLGASTTEFRNDQFGLFKVVPNEWHGSVEADFLEVDQSNKTRLISTALSKADPVANEHRTNFVAATKFTRVRLALLGLDENGLVHAIVVPAAQWNGGDIQRQLGHGQMQSLPMNWSVLTDDDVRDPDTGDAILAFDLDQF